jgi:hypothetical protein
VSEIDVAHDRRSLARYDVDDDFGLEDGKLADDLLEAKVGTDEAQARRAQSEVRSSGNREESRVALKEFPRRRFGALCAGDERAVDPGRTLFLLAPVDLDDVGAVRRELLAGCHGSAARADVLRARAAPSKTRCVVMSTPSVAANVRRNALRADNRLELGVQESVAANGSSGADIPWMRTEGLAMLRGRVLARLLIPAFGAVAIQTVAAEEPAAPPPPPAKSIHEWRMTPEQAAAASAEATPTAPAKSIREWRTTAAPAPAPCPMTAPIANLAARARCSSLVQECRSTDESHHDQPQEHATAGEPRRHARRRPGLQREVPEAAPDHLPDHDMGSLQIKAGTHRLTAKVYGKKKTYFSKSYDLEVSTRALPCAS